MPALPVCLLRPQRWRQGHSASPDVFPFLQRGNCGEVGARGLNPSISCKHQLTRVFLPQILGEPSRCRRVRTGAEQWGMLPRWFALLWNIDKKVANHQAPNPGLIEAQQFPRSLQVSGFRPMVRSLAQTTSKQTWHFFFARVCPCSTGQRGRWTARQMTMNATLMSHRQSHC